MAQTGSCVHPGEVRTIVVLWLPVVLSTMQMLNRARFCCRSADRAIIALFVFAFIELWLVALAFFLLIIWRAWFCFRNTCVCGGVLKVRRGTFSEQRACQRGVRWWRDNQPRSMRSGPRRAHSRRAGGGVHSRLSNGRHPHCRYEHGSDTQRADDRWQHGHWPGLCAFLGAVCRFPLRCPARTHAHTSAKCTHPYSRKKLSLIHI